MKELEGLSQGQVLEALIHLLEELRFYRIGRGEPVKGPQQALDVRIAFWNYETCVVPGLEEARVNEKRPMRSLL